MRLQKSSLFTVLFALALSRLSLTPSLELSARSLDALLQRSAFEALSLRLRTGVVSDAKLPANLTALGASASALRLRSGSFRSRGFDAYKEFRIPVGVVEQPYAKRIVLVYQNLGLNFSSRFYPLPGFTYLAPVLGLIAYDASNLSAVDLPELDLRATGKPISARFGGIGSGSGSGPRCVFFDLHGSVQFDEPLRGDTCEMVQQGHLSIVVESTAPCPAPAGGEGYDGGAGGRGKGRVDKSKAGAIAGCLVGVLVLVAAAVVLGLKIRERRSNGEQRRKEGAERGSGQHADALEMTSFGSIRAPFARVTRTQPVLEDRYVP